MIQSKQNFIQKATNPLRVQHYTFYAKIRAMSLSYPDAVEWYYSFARFDPNLSRVADPLKLAQMREILGRLDHPEAKFASVLIAGTKGKGSTAALIESILRAAGYRTGLFTSPHLHSFRERVRVNNEQISREQIIQDTARLQSIAAEYPGSTFFEWVTALAFNYFAEQQIEIGVIEVGLGGRLDYTNVLTPRVSIITPISYDHMDILGHTLTAIAGEKAGIIKPNVPVVVAPQDAEAFAVLLGTADELYAPLINVAEQWQWEPVGSTTENQIVRVRRTQAAGWDEYTLPLLGPHQRANLATALAAVCKLRDQGWKIPARAIRQGVTKVKWDARFEILAHAPYIVADGAHNRASAHELVRTLNEVFPNAKVHFIFGASTEKDIAGMLDEIAPRAASIVFTQSHHSRSAEPAALAHMLKNHSPDMHVTPTVREALELAQKCAGAKDVLCVTGSLFIAAEARAVVLDIQQDD